MIARYAVKLVKETRSKYGVKTITVPADAAAIATKLISDSPQEKLIALHLDGKNEVVGYNIVSSGLLDRSLVHPRETFQAAILANAASIILAHNHPSGQLVPSGEDRTVTFRLRDAGKLLGIELVDHLIVTRSGYYSFKEHGEL